MGISKKNNLAFTLAEVLITIGIIGIVAQMTIPGLVSDYKKKLTAIQLKKLYSTVNQALNLSIAANGDIKNWAWPAAPDNANMTTFVNTYVTPYFIVQKNCGWESWGGGVCHTSRAYYLDKTTTFGASGLTFILGDGTLISMSTTAPGGARIFMDLNGNNPPNIVGKDVFHLVIMPGGKLLFYPGWWDPITTKRSDIVGTGDYACNKSANSNAGISCGMLMQLDGWEIKDDYPWD